MGRVVKWLIGAAIFAAAIGGILAYDRITTLESEAVTDDVSVIFGFGGNVGVLRTGDGAVVVDTMTFITQGRHLRDLADEIGGGPIQAIINTHYHIDHSHGNPGFAPGTKVVATRRTRDYLVFFDGDYWKDGTASNVPNELFEDTHQLRIGGKTIRLHFLGRGHTGGDLVVQFVEDRVLHAGDLFFNDYYPNIDLEAGGSISEWIGTLDRVLALDVDRIIPGHGPVTDKDGLRAYQEFLRELWSQASAAAAAGRTLQETLDSVKLTHDAGFGVIGVPLVFKLDRDFVVKRAWEEATGVVKPAEVPPAAS